MDTERPPIDNGILTVLMYLAAVFLGAALIAPWLHHGVQALATPIPGLAALARQPFHRYVNRCLLGLAILGLPWLIRSSRIRTASDLGYAWHPGDFRRLLYGIAVAWASLALVGFAAVAAGERLPKSGLTAPVILQQVFKASMTAAVVALIEELLFRGILLRLLARNLSGTAAVVTSAAIYSAVHFLDRPPQPEVVESLTGFWVLGQMCRGLLQPSALWPGFASLLVVGWILGRSYLATGTLWLSVGLHAGWIFWLKALGMLTRTIPGSPTAWLWGGERVYDGHAALVALALATLLVERRLAAESKARPNPATPAF